MEKLKDWFFLVTAIAFGIYFSKWLLVITTWIIFGGRGGRY